MVTTLALGAARALSSICYEVTPSADLMTVEVKVTVPSQGQAVDVTLPSWSPGYYVLENYSSNLKDVVAKAPDGSVRPVSHPRPDTWHIDPLGAQAVTVSYTRPVVHESGRMGIFSGDDVTVHYGGPSIYLYVEARKSEPCTVQFHVPKNLGLAVSLDPVGNGLFTAPNYDVLADSPVTIGTFRTAEYISRGKPHQLAVRGSARDRLDMARAVKMTRFITESETDFFGKSAPYNRYVWHIWAGDTPDGAGGLEHASSSQDFLSLAQGPASMRGLAHECFHLWNVKRIRSASLGPFDYTRLPRTGALWWLEGVTDYYASLIPHRYGWYGDDQYYKDIAANIRAVRSNPKRLEVSPYESSFRVGETNDGRGNSNGFGVDYYPTGWVTGMLLDIELRARTGGKHNLDEIELALWDMCKDGKPGFDEGELRRQFVRVGGPEMGAVFDKWVMQPGDPPVELQLAKVGLSVGGTGRDLKVTESPTATPEQKKLREGWFFGKRSRPSALQG
ncbi:MAG: M61 family metallopeptidase [Armatimonadetes bacterium]|nr:M61 family metallopeptidase [Armatimonadota bacterium]